MEKKVNASIGKRFAWDELLGGINIIGKETNRKNRVMGRVKQYFSQKSIKGYLDK